MAGAPSGIGSANENTTEIPIGTKAGAVRRGIGRFGGLAKA